MKSTVCALRGLISLLLLSVWACHESSGSARQSEGQTMAGDPLVDASAEAPADATTPECDPLTEFSCGDGSCVRRVRRCDDWMDCPNGSDEAQCDSCNASEHTCLDGSCIPAAQRCDGTAHCTGGDDELECAALCGGFTCSSGQCVKASDRCDGKRNCFDRSDEFDCPSECPAAPDTWERYMGSTNFSEADYRACQARCQQQPGCFDEANCPGISQFNRCFSTELSACSLRKNGKCRAEFERMTCCAIDAGCDVSDSSCLQTHCSRESSRMELCLQADLSCSDDSYERCWES